MLSREELYEKVWSTPTIRLAKEFGVSDVAIAKICKKHQIPKPPLGYWARIEAGYKPRRPLLPKTNELVREPVIINTRIVPPEISQVLSIPATEKSVPKIRVPEALTTSHMLTKQTRKMLRSARVNEYGLLRTAGPDCLDVSVSKATVGRALRIFDTLIRELEARGHPTSVTESYGKFTTVLKIGGETFELRLQEIVHRKDHAPSEKELKEKQRYSWASWRKWDFFPSGDLSLQFSGRGWGITQRKWSDGKKRRLEECLSDFIEGIEKSAMVAANLRKAEDERRDEQKRLQEEADERRRQQQREEQRLKALEAEAAAWRKAANLRQYVDAVENAFITKGGVIDRDSTAGRWISWARQHAETIDPVPQLVATITAAEREKGVE